ncbi:MAG: carboxylesterase/lipase family protein, partial [Acidimicrobiales bacterium]
MIVETTAGKIEGFERDGTLRFRGIPFAAPPVGALRFRPPQPVEPWDGVRDATKFGAMAPQGLGGLEAMMGAARYPQSEDCLYLNVVTPGGDDAARPVMVWIHGGGFVAGSGAIPWYHGTELARKDDVVIVSINYRLGAPGFTHIGPALGDEYATAGNSGILDQIAALQWVRDNIAAFGGDPGAVTIFGESAGGMSVGTLLGTPAAAGLFGRAIAQSGAAHNATPADHAASIADELALQLDGSTPEVLLSVDIDTLLAAQQAVATRRLGEIGRQDMALLGFQPVVDGVVLPQSPLETIRSGSAAGIDVIAGTTAHEFTLFNALLEPKPLDDALLLNRVERAIGSEHGAAVLDAYRQTMPDATLDDLWTAIGTDGVFRIPAIRLLEAQSTHRPEATFAYLFTYESTAFGGRLRASHAVDIPFVFDVVGRSGTELLLGEVTDDARRLSGITRATWAQ